MAYVSHESTYIRVYDISFAGFSLRVADIFMSSITCCQVPLSSSPSSHTQLQRPQNYDNPISLAAMKISGKLQHAVGTSRRSQHWSSTFCLAMLHLMGKLSSSSPFIHAKLEQRTSKKRERSVHNRATTTTTKRGTKT